MPCLGSLRSVSRYLLDGVDTLDGLDGFSRGQRYLLKASWKSAT